MFRRTVYATSAAAATLLLVVAGWNAYDHRAEIRAWLRM